MRFQLSLTRSRTAFLQGHCRWTPIVLSRIDQPTVTVLGLIATTTSELGGLLTRHLCNLEPADRGRYTAPFIHHAFDEASVARHGTGSHDSRYTRDLSEHAPLNHSHLTLPPCSQSQQERSRPRPVHVPAGGGGVDALLRALREAAQVRPHIYLQPRVRVERSAACSACSHKYTDRARRSAVQEPRPRLPPLPQVQRLPCHRQVRGHHFFCSCVFRPSKSSKALT